MSGYPGDAWRSGCYFREGGSGQSSDALPGVMLLDPPPGGAAHAVAQILVGEQAWKTRWEGLCALRRDEVAALTIGHARLYTADPRADDRGRAGHRFERRHPKRLIMGDGHGDIGGGVVEVKLLLRLAPGEGYPLLDSELAGKGREPLGLGRLSGYGLPAHDHEPRVEPSRQEGEGLNNSIYALARHESADVDDC